MFYFYAKRGGLTPQQRAENVSHEITTLGKRFNLHPDSVYIESTDIVTDVMYGDKVIVSFTDQDGLWESCTRDQLAAAKRTVIVEKLKVMKEEHGLLQLFKRIAYFVLVLVGQFLLFKLTNWLFRKLKVRILRLRNTRLKAFSIQNFELLDTQKQVRLLVFVANLFRYAFMVAMIYPYLPGPLQRRGRGNHVAPLHGHARRQRPRHAEGRLERKAEGKVNRDVLRDLGRPGYRDFLPVRRLGRLAYRDFLPVRRLGRPTIGIFAPSDVSDSSTIGIFAPSDVSDSSTIGIFAPSDVSDGSTIGIFALSDVSDGSTIGIFYPSDVSDGSTIGIFCFSGKGYLLRFTVCNTRPVLSIMRSSSVRGVAEMMEKPASGLQYTVPSMALTLRLSEPLELVT